MTTLSPPSKLDECRSLYEQGAGDVEIANKLGMTIKAFRELYDDNEPFRNFVDQGNTTAQAWWWEQARTNLKNKNFISSLWTINMKNRYGWAEKTDNTSVLEGDIDINSAHRQLESALKQLTKKNPDLARQLNFVQN